MQVSELLSPASGISQEARRRGRFFRQVAADAMSFGHNLPQRQLLCDQLDLLPTILHRLLHDANAYAICRAGRNSLSALELDELRNLSLVQIDSLLDKSCQFFEKLAQEARRTSPSAAPLYSRPCDPAPELDRCWWAMLVILRPYLERKIWLTEMSAPLPFHALCRMHDMWSLMILLWCYQNRTWFRASHDDGCPVFWTDSLVIFCHGPVPHESEDQRIQALTTVIGPVLQPFKRSISSSEYEQDDDRLAEYFVRLVKLASECIFGSNNHSDVLPTGEELRDSIGSRLRTETEEIQLRVRALKRSWELLEAAQTVVEDLGFSEWEGLASLAVWLSRFEAELAQHARGAKLYLPLKGGRYCLEFQTAEECHGKPHLLITMRPADWTLHQEETANSLMEVKRKCRSFDRPITLLSRMRERRSAHWSFQILAINGLLQRSHQQQKLFSSMFKNMPTSARIASSDSEQRKKWDEKVDMAEHLLLGFGGRLSHYMVNITHADLCTIFWLDYAEDPPRLIPVAGYSRNHVLHATARDIHWSFDCAVTKDEARSKRAKSASLLYRACAENQSRIEDEMSNCILEGYPDNLRPKSALAVPVRHNGRVVGLIELKGLVSGQFSKALISPLWRAANIIGPFMFHNLFLWQIRCINELIATRSRPSWDRGKHNRLGDISLLLCNIFLCPVVHLWIRTDNKLRFRLVGFNRPSIFRETIQQEDVAPSITVSATEGPYSVAKSFAELALSLAGKGEASLGKFVKAHFYDELEPVGYSLDNALEEAQSSGIKLYRSFLDARTGSEQFRRRIFLDERLHELMAFSLIRASTEESMTDGGAVKSHHFVTEGFITLHDHGDSSLAWSGYSLGWAPVVAYMQTYLTHLLSQLELLNEAWQQARNILIHEAIHVLSTVERRVQTASKQNYDLHHGGARDALRRWVQRLPDTERELRRTVLSSDDLVVLQRDLARIQQSLLAAGDSATYLEGMSNRLCRLEARLRHRRSFRILEVSPGEEKVWIRLREDLFQRLRSYKDALEEKGVKFPQVERAYGWRVYIEKSLWDRITYNLLDNMTKYSPANTVCNLILDTKGKTLEFQNYGKFHANDTAERLCSLGQRGELVSTQEGDGIGLWVIGEACKLAGIRFQVRIDESPTLGYSMFRAVLYLHNVLDRTRGEGYT